MLEIGTRGCNDFQIGCSENEHIELSVCESHRTG